MTGKTVRLYMVDGHPTGIITAEIINWTGKVIIAPRNRLSDLAKRDEVRRTGVYFLVGPDPEDSTRTRVYVGEADSVIKRLIYHDRDEDKDFFGRIAVVISKDDNITKSHGRYLESRLIALVRSAGRAVAHNSTAPEAPLLPEPDVADMEYFLEQVQLILPVVSMNFLQPKPSIDTTNAAIDTATSPRFVLTTVGTQAHAVETEGEFLVLKGSTARKQGVDSWHSFRGLRDSLVEGGKLVDSVDPDYYQFIEDTPFSSPSAAASVIAARSTNGRIYWKVEPTGQSYGDWHEQQLDAID